MLVWAILLVLVAFAALHIYWGAGGTWAVDKVTLPPVGKQEPVRLEGVRSYAIAAGMILAALVVVIRTGLWNPGLPEAPFRIAIWLVAALFAMRALGDRQSKDFIKKEWSTSFAKVDTLIISPLCLAVAVGIGYLAATA